MLDESHRSRGINTQQRLKRLQQESLDGMPPLAFLEAGYELNKLQTAISETYLVCPYKTSILWTHPLSMPVSQASIIPLAFQPVKASAVVTLALIAAVRRRKVEQGA